MAHSAFDTSTHACLHSIINRLDVDGQPQKAEEYFGVRADPTRISRRTEAGQVGTK